MAKVASGCACRTRPIPRLQKRGQSFLAFKRHRIFINELAALGAMPSVEKRSDILFQAAADGHLRFSHSPNL